MFRRAFVKSGALALVTMGLSPSFLRRSALALDLPRARKGKVLVCLFQRGAADAVSMIVPHGDAGYYAARPSLAIARPRAGATDSALELDGMFGLHPAMASLAPLYRDGLLAPIVAVGSPSATRSHFDAQDYMESGTPDFKGTRDGWLNRWLAVSGTCEACTADDRAPSPFRAVAMTTQTPRILQGSEAAIAMASLGSFTVRAPGSAAERLEALYRGGAGADPVQATGREMFDAVRMLQAADPARYRPQATYPRSPFGQRLLEIAQLIKANVGLEIAFADVGGWDTHVAQGAATGLLATRLRDFADSIAAFVTDLGDRMDDVLVLTMTEFGRTIRPNGSGGTDHGHAGAMFAIGGGVQGGRVHGRWPGLAREQLNEGRDLALTTDFRTVFDEVLARHFGATGHTGTVFPGFGQGAEGWRGILRAS